MVELSRRRLLQGAAVAGGVLAASARSLRAQNKPDKLVYIGENQGGWKRVLMEEGIKKFADPQKALLALIAQRRAELEPVATA